MLNLPAGDAAVPFTTAIMHDCAHALAERHGAALRRAVLDSAGASVPEKVFRFARERYSFAADPGEVEFIRNHDAQVRAMLSGGQAAGDCDDLAVIVAACLIACKTPYAFFAVSRDRGPFAHVLTAAGSPLAGWCPIDPQEAERAGQWPAAIVRQAVWMEQKA